MKGVKRLTEVHLEWPLKHTVCMCFCSSLFYLLNIVKKVPENASALMFDLAELAPPGSRQSSGYV